MAKYSTFIGAMLSTCAFIAWLYFDAPAKHVAFEGVGGIAAIGHGISRALEQHVRADAETERGDADVEAAGAAKDD